MKKVLRNIRKMTFFTATTAAAWFAFVGALIHAYGLMTVAFIAACVIGTRKW